MAQTTGCGITNFRLVSGFRWLISFALVSLLAACGGGGGSGQSAGAVTESANNASCSYQHLYITVEQVRVRQQVNGSEQWTEIVLTAPQRIDLMNLGGGLLQALGAAPLAPGHYTEVLLILAAQVDGAAVWPTPCSRRAAISQHCPCPAARKAGSS